MGMGRLCDHDQCVAFEKHPIYCWHTSSTHVGSTSSHVHVVTQYPADWFYNLTPDEENGVTTVYGDSNNGQAGNRDTYANWHMNRCRQQGKGYNGPKQRLLLFGPQIIFSCSLLFFWGRADWQGCYHNSTTNQLCELLLMTQKQRALRRDNKGWKQQDGWCYLWQNKWW